MKNKLFLFLTCLGAASFASISAFDSSSYFEVFASNKPELEKSNITVDIYAEYDFVLTNYNEELEYTWSSSDTSLATIDNNGHMSCLGKVGELTITVSHGKEKDTCEVSIKNQMINPSISVADCLGFVNTPVTPVVEVRYDGNYYPLENYTLTSLDTSIATVNTNGQFIGVKEGEVDIEVNGVWKNKTLKSKKFTATIQSENSIVLDQESYDVYSVDETSPRRKNYVDINAQIFVRGESFDGNVGVDLGINPYLSSDGNRVSVINQYKGEEVLSYEVSVYCIEKPEVSTKTTIRLHPNFEAKLSHEEIVETFRADIEFGYEEFEGHSNAYKYKITDHDMNKNAANPTWATWDSRIEFFETTNKNGVVAYDYMVEKGYTLLSFDYYYLGQKGILMGAYGAPAKQYFYNEVQVNRTDMLLVNQKGKATNILTNDQWYTVYINISEVVLKSMTIGQDAATLYVGPCYIGDVSYFDNIRYYYDYSPLNDIELVFDTDERELTIDGENPNKATSENEMVVYSPNYVSYTHDEVSNLYKYDSSNAKALDRESRSKINAYNLLNGLAVNKGYKYLAFSYIYRSGTPLLSYFNDFVNGIKTISLDNNFKPNNFVSIYKDGKPIKTIVKDELCTVVVKVDGRVNDSTYLSSALNTVFEIGEFAYYKDNSYIKDYSYNAPFKVLVDNIDIGFVGDTIDLKKQISVIYNGEAIKNPNISGFIFSNRKVDYLGGSEILLKEVGDINISFVITHGDYKIRESISIVIKNNYMLSLTESNISLYAGDKDYFEKEYLIQPYAIFNKQFINPSALNYEIVSGEEFVSLDGNLVTAMKEGDAEIKVSLPDNSEHQILKVNVFNKYRKGSFEFTSIDTTYPASYSQVSGVIEGISNPHAYSAAAASWNNKLDISDTKHTSTASSKNNIINGHIDFIEYWILLTPGTYLRAASVNPNGGHSTVPLTVNASFSSANNENINLYTASGDEATTINANTWYRLVVDYSNFESQYKSGYTCHELAYIKGTCYISDIRYYHDSIN